MNLSRCIFFPVLTLACCTCAFAQTYTIGTFAGGGLPDNTPASLLALKTTQAVAVDAAGNLLIGLPDYHVVVKMDVRTGFVTRVAGIGTAGNSGDGGPATGAQLDFPAGLAIDSTGSIYVADQLRCVVRKIAGGIISTVAGNGKCGFSGDNGAATVAQLNGPVGIAVDASLNLYIADTNNLRVREVSAGIITTLAGDGHSGAAADGPVSGAHLFLPSGVAVDSSGAVYIADTYNHCVRKVSGGRIVTVAGGNPAATLGDGGPAVDAALNLPSGLAFDAAGNLYIVDTPANRIRMVADGYIATIAGNGSQGFSGDGGLADAAQLNNPASLALAPGGAIYIADSGNSRIRIISAGFMDTIAGHGDAGYAGDGGPATNAQLATPSGVALDFNGNLYIADTGNHAVRMVVNNKITTVAGNGTAGYSGDGGPAAKAQLNAPLAVATDSAGNLYIADTGNNVVRKVSGGIITTVAGNGTAANNGDGGPATSASVLAPSSVAVDSAGTVYIASNSQTCVPNFFGQGCTLQWSGSVRTVQNAIMGTVPGAVGRYIGGLAIDTAGSLYFSSRDDARVYQMVNGVAAVVAGVGAQGFGGDNGPAIGGQLSHPSGIGVDAQGDVWIADTGNQRIRKVVSGAIATVAGAGAAVPQGTAQFGGDGGPADSALLNAPLAVAADLPGRVYIADSANQRIRVLVPASGCPASVAWSSLQAEAAGSTLTASIVTSPGCAWSIAGLPDWIALAGASTGSGSATEMLTVGANAGPSRTVTIAVAGNNATITQAGATYVVSGHIRLGGQPLAGVLLGLSNNVSSAQYSGKTDANGFYTISFPAANAVYFMNASLAGYSFLSEANGVMLPSAEVLPFENQTVDFTAWTNPKMNGIAAVFGSAIQAAQNAFAPGEILSIYGTSLCTGTQAASAPLPDAMAGCAVLLDSAKLPLYYSSPNQINAVLPLTATAGVHSVVVWRYTDSTNSQVAATDSAPVNIRAASLAFVEVADGGGTSVAVQHPDGSFAGVAKPVSPGEIVSLYLTGLGSKDHVFADGTAPGTQAEALQQPRIHVEGTAARMYYAGVQPQFPGLDQIVFQLPAYALASGSNTISLEIDTADGSQSVIYKVPAGQ
jgi:uncharacterized protein (TIGR03437 family)